MKIALVGNAGVGKTTAATLLHERLGIEIHPEIESRLIKKLIARKIIKDKYDFTPDQSKAFQNRSLCIRERLSLRPSFISDRTAGELWVYHQIYCGSYSTEEELKNFRERCLKVMLQYTHIFLFPFGQIPLEDNQLRNTNLQYQQRIYDGIKLMLVDFKLPHVSLVEKTLTREERLEEILLYLN